MFFVYKSYDLLIRYTELLPTSTVRKLAAEFPEVLKQLDLCKCDTNGKQYKFAHDEGCPLIGVDVVISKEMKSHSTSIANSRLIKIHFAEFQKKFHEKVVRDVANLCELIDEVKCTPYQRVLELLISKYLFDISDVIELKGLEPLITYGNRNKIALDKDVEVRESVMFYLTQIGYTKSAETLCNKIWPNNDC